MIRWYCSFALSVLVLMGSEAPPVIAGLSFTLNDTGGTAVGTQARQGFQEAADFWSSSLGDNINVNLDIGFEALGPGTLGSTSFSAVSGSYAQYRSAVVADINSSDDMAFSVGLPGGPTFSVYINRTSDNPNGANSAAPYVDNDGGSNNSQIQLSTANAKALGLIAPFSPGIDATIKFSSNFNFDFDRSNGIGSGAFDFVGVAIHEIGHALGFYSGVDTLDVFPGANDNSYLATTLDFTRFSQESQMAGADLDLTADPRAKYFSVDGGTSVDVADAFSTGRNSGDGNQASHWKDNRMLGVMDPTATAGELLVVTPLDFRAFDVVGYDVVAVPEPSTFAMVGFVLSCAVLARKRQKKAQSCCV